MATAMRRRKHLEACKPLGDYSWFVAKIRSNCAAMGIEQAVDEAVSSMPDNFVLKSFLEAHRAEVKGIMETEYNEAEAMNLFKEDGRAEGMDVLSRLIAILLKNKDYESIEKVSSDKSVRNRLLQKYHLV